MTNHHNNNFINYLLQMALANKSIISKFDSKMIDHYIFELRSNNRLSAESLRLQVVMQTYLMSCRRAWSPHSRRGLSVSKSTHDIVIKPAL